MEANVFKISASKQYWAKIKLSDDIMLQICLQPDDKGLYIFSAYASGKTTGEIYVSSPQEAIEYTLKWHDYNLKGYGTDGMGLS